MNAIAWLIAEIERREEGEYLVASEDPRQLDRARAELDMPPAIAKQVKFARIPEALGTCRVRAAVFYRSGRTAYERAFWELIDRSSMLGLGTSVLVVNVSKGESERRGRISDLYRIAPYGKCTWCGGTTTQAAKTLELVCESCGARWTKSGKPIHKGAYNPLRKGNKGADTKY